MHDQQFLWAHYIPLLVSQFSLETQFHCNNETQMILYQNMIQKMCNTPTATPKGNSFVGQRNLVPGNYSLSCYKIISNWKMPRQNLRLLGWNITASTYKCFIQMQQLVWQNYPTPSYWCIWFFWQYPHPQSKIDDNCKLNSSCKEDIQKLSSRLQNSGAHYHLYPDGDENSPPDCSMIL